MIKPLPGDTRALMPKALLCLVFLALGLSQLASVSVNSIFSRDAGKEVNNLRIGLSAEASYRVESSADGKTHRVLVQGAQNQVERPDYQRLSPVIDRVSAYQQGDNTIVEIRTMRASRVSHSQSSSGIIVQLNQGSQSVPVADPTADKASNPVSKRPRRIRTPRITEDIPPPEMEIAPAVTAVDSVPAPAPKTVAPAIPKVQDQRLLAFVRANLLWMLLLLAGLFLLIVAIRIGRRTPRLKEVPDSEETPALIIDSSTRNRMVMRLVEQGWTAPQVAGELRIPVKEVERVIALAKKRPEL